MDKSRLFDLLEKYESYSKPQTDIYLEYEQDIRKTYENHFGKKEYDFEKIVSALIYSGYDIIKIQEGYIKRIKEITSENALSLKRLTEESIQFIETSEYPKETINFSVENSQILNFLNAQQDKLKKLGYTTTIEEINSMPQYDPSANSSGKTYILRGNINPYFYRLLKLAEKV